MERFLLAILVVALAVPSLSAADAKFRRSARPAAGHYIVMLEPSGTQIDLPIQALTNMHGGEVTHVFRGAPWEGYSVRNLPEPAALALSRDPRVQAVEEDGLAELLQITPQHPQWALDRTNQRNLPLDNLLSAGCVDSSMVHIYIMDSGINDPAGTEFGTRLIHGYKAPGIASFADIWSIFGHGTLVASIAGGSTYGVATSAKIVNVKVVEEGQDALNVSSRATIAIRDYINVHVTNRPKVVNISILYPLVDSGLSALELEIQNSIATHKITYVVGAGNGNSTGTTGIDACIAGAPARMGPTAGLITVGGSYLVPTEAGLYTMDERSDHAGFRSNWGSCVDIFAPGTKVASLSRLGNEHAASGTSHAAPQVAGAAARRQASRWTSTGTIMLPADVEAAVKADSTPNVINPLTIGAGSPNLLLYRFYLKCRAVG